MWTRRPLANDSSSSLTESNSGQSRPSLNSCGPIASGSVPSSTPPGERPWYLCPAYSNGGWSRQNPILQYRNAAFATPSSANEIVEDLSPSIFPVQSNDSGGCLCVIAKLLANSPSPRCSSNPDRLPVTVPHSSSRTAMYTPRRISTSPARTVRICGPSSSTVSSPACTISRSGGSSSRPYQSSCRERPRSEASPLMARPLGGRNHQSSQDLGR